MVSNVSLSDPVPDYIVKLQSRIEALEAKAPPTRVVITETNNPPHATDPFACHMYVLATAAGFKDTKFVRAHDDYYDRPIETRRAFLNAPHIRHLSKSIVMENTRFKGISDPSHVTSSKYVCVVTPYTMKIDSDRLRNFIRQMYKECGKEVPGMKAMNYRLVEDCVGVTGYTPNGVAPLGLKTEMPIVLAKEIMDLNPGEFWMGGGEISMKWRVLVKEFCDVYNPVVMDFTAR